MLVDTALEAEWDALVDRAGASPFHRPGWFTAWWAAFGHGTPVIEQRRRDGRLTAVLPMSRVRGQLVGLHNWHTFTNGPVAESAADAREILDHTLTDARWSASLSHLLPDDLDATLDLARSRGFHVDVTSVQRSPYIEVSGSFDTYLAARDTRWIRQLNKRRAKLEARGELRLDIYDGSTDLVAHTAEAFRIEALGWKSESGTAIISDPRTEAFYRAVLQWAATKGILRIAMLSLDGQSIAADICLEDAGVHYFLKTGFDPDFRDTAPGLILRHDMIRRAFESDLTSYEMLGSAEPYKMQWTDTTHQISAVRTYPPSLPGHSARWARSGRLFAGKAVRRAARTLRRPRAATG